MARKVKYFQKDIIFALQFGMKKNVNVNPTWKYTMIHSSWRILEWIKASTLRIFWNRAKPNSDIVIIWNIVRHNISIISSIVFFKLLNIPSTCLPSTITRAGRKFITDKFQECLIFLARGRFAKNWFFEVCFPAMRESRGRGFHENPFKLERALRCVEK